MTEQPDTSRTITTTLEELQGPSEETKIARRQRIAEDEERLKAEEEQA